MYLSQSEKTFVYFNLIVMAKDSLSVWLEGSGLIGKKNSDSEKTEKSTPKKVNKTKKATDKKPSVKGKGGNGSKRGKRPNFNGPVTNNDPTYHRPTAEKREKFHPTNFIKPKEKPKIRIVPIGGMEQVGMNMMFLEWENDIIIIDTGLVFPDPEHMGVDALVPDISYLVKNKKKIRGIFYTHGHMDHIGGAPYLLEELGFPPVYATRLTKELLLLTCDERLDTKRIKVTEITPKSKIKLGKFDVEFFHVNHSIPDSVGIVVNTPYGAVVHTSDFKIDFNPADDQPADLGRIADIGRKGVYVAMSDSTNAGKPGQTVSERVIAEDLAKVIQKTPGRIVMATFASNIGRIAKVVEAAEKAGRTVFLSGRSMERNIAVARKLNYLKCKDDTLQIMNQKADKMDPRKVMILSTGSQGESLAALTRMAAGIHPKVKLRHDDTIIFASSPIPGNETAVVSVLNNLADIGCSVIDHKAMNTHVSGHGNAEECKLMCQLLNPKYFVPIHGEVFMRHEHRNLIVRDLGFNPEKAFIMKNGRGIQLDASGVRLMTEKEALPEKYVLVQLGEKVQDKVLEDRQKMSEYGVLMAFVVHSKGTIKSINFRTRGFLYMNAEHEIFKLLEKEMRDVWTRNYDPARPEKALEKPLSQIAERILLQKFKKETLVEVVV